MLYAALSRVKSFNDVQVIGFGPHHVQNRENEERVIKQHLHMVNNMWLCFKSVDSMPGAKEADYITQDEMSDEALLEVVHSMFEPIHQGEDEDEGGTSMEAVLELMEESEHSLSSLPDDFDVRALLTSFKGDCYGNEQNNFEFQKNQAIDKALCRIDIFSSLIQIVWFKVFQLLRANVKDNIADTKFSSKQMKSLFQKSYDISQSNDMKRLLRLCFNTSE